MSILSVANVHFETTAANRIEYLAANGLLNLVTSGNIAISSRNFTLSNNAGLSGNVLTSNGTTWISQAPAGVSLRDESSSASTYYPTLTTATTGSITAANTSSSKLYYVPSTGTLSATNFNSLSDINFKTDIHTIENPLAVVENLRGVNFKWKENGEDAMGLIAQEVEKYLPQVINTNNDIKSINYDGLIGLLIEAIKELKKQIDNSK